MSHILIGLAVCASLLIYPGGLTLLCGAWLLSKGSSMAAAGWRRRTQVDKTIVPLALASLAVVPLPWPGNPALALTAGGLSQVGVGGLGLTALGLLGMELWLANGKRTSSPHTLLPVLTVLAILVLAEVVAAPDWASLLAATGTGAEAGRVGVGVACLLAFPWASGDPAGSRLAVACAAATRFAVAAFLIFPQVARTPVWLGLGVWLAACLAFGALWGVARRFELGRPAKPGLPGSADRLRLP